MEEIARDFGDKVVLIEDTEVVNERIIEEQKLGDSVHNEEVERGNGSRL